MVKVFGFLLLLFCLLGHGYSTNSTTTKHYIVYMGKHSYPNSESLISSNHEMLASVMGSINDAREATIHHYHKSFRGFSAKLTTQQAKQIAKNDSVVSVFESQLVHLHTTRSWVFMGSRAKSIFIRASAQKNFDVIVGHFDSGVWPESPSFNPKGFGPVPERFRGECESGERFSAADCNYKIIGARYYYRGFEEDSGPLEGQNRPFFRSPRDDFGHGSHTASTAVGSIVRNVTFSRIGTDMTLRGGAPKARIAVYKVCWFNQCSCADVLKAYDDAIYDNVDIITMSLGTHVSHNNPDFLSDCFSLGALHAFQNGILVTASAGNHAEPRTVANAAPWILTVAASSIDREFVAPVKLGNGISLKGYAQNYKFHPRHIRSVITAISASNPGVPAETASACKWDSLDYGLIRGKIVVCTMENWDDDKVEKSRVIRDGGGVGVIIIDPNSYKETSLDYDLPTSVIGQEEADKLHAYLRKSENPTAYIHDTNVVIRTKPAPEMAYFSSRGPGSALDIIKPDITAPGVNIFAAWPPGSDEQADAQWFQIDSGTSMSCPHVSGVAAVIKGIHRNWSPAEVKSAIMTTATVLDNTGQPIRSGQTMATPFDFGSGHLRPNHALTPGLVYDFNMGDIVSYLCSSGVNNRQLRNLVGGNVWCPYPPVAPYNLNYPSIGVSNLVGQTTVFRTVTYRGKKGDPTSFELKIEHPEGIYLEVQPNFLDFSGGRTTITYTVNILVKEALGRDVFGSITWFNNFHRVRSPVAIKTV